MIPSHFLHNIRSSHSFFRKNFSTSIRSRKKHYALLYDVISISNNPETGGVFHEKRIVLPSIKCIFLKQYNAELGFHYDIKDVTKVPNSHIYLCLYSEKIPQISDGEETITYRLVGKTEISSALLKSIKKLAQEKKCLDQGATSLSSMKFVTKKIDGIFKHIQSSC